GSNLKAGDILTEKNVRNVRPGLGLPTMYYDLVIGKSIKHDVKKGTPLIWDLLL
uniref:SAF domain-containing protein n=1 Tax=Bacillus velezensis TaxID=492670 RepID=UPI0024BED2E5